MQYFVRQTFETLGDPCDECYDSREAAEQAAAELVAMLADMVAGWETDDERSYRPTAYANENAAWREAAEIAGVKYDDAGRRTDESPTVYGAEAGEYIAVTAVEIEEEEGGCE